MPPPLNHPPQDINRTTIQPRPQSVAFSYLLTRERICAELTTELASSLTQKKIINQLVKVNKPRTTNYISITCKSPILLTVKPDFHSINPSLV